ncbi:MAG: DUF1285 domain-containing protein [bacterium]
MTQIENLFAQLDAIERAPVARWHPRESLDIGLRVDADGQWRCRGSTIARARMVKLFGSVLRLDADGRHYLVTPRVKYPVAVADAPFRAVELRRRKSGRAQELFFRTNMDDVVRADREHPIQVRAGPAPYVEVRDGLQAKITRAVYYELTELLETLGEREARDEVNRDGEDDGDESGDEDGEVLGVYSAGEFFLFGRAR